MSITRGLYEAAARHARSCGFGTSRDGKLTSIRHEGWEISSRPDPNAVGGTKTTTWMYACPKLDSLVSIVRADRNTPGLMRAPPEVPYMFALESAMDELAHELKMNPIELRRVNETMKEPVTGLPYP
jgi:xanthine dehydrogenase YagR molybdenum-binding subunit